MRHLLLFFSRAYVLAAMLALLICPGTVRAESSEARQSDDPRFDWFFRTRAGMFIHWGPYSVAAGEWKGKKGSRDAHLQHEFRIPKDEYHELASRFNPVKFDADAWVRLAKDAGLGYVVYVSKHHDGFAMFDSPSNPYNIVKATPFGRDPLKEIAEACARHGLVLCVYYSLGRDWSVPGVPTGGRRCNDWDFPSPPADALQSYLEGKVKPQLRELLTGYGPIGAVWFDTPEQVTPEQSKDLRRWILSIQPDCLINARIGNDKGDYDIHEQRIPSTAIHRPWEACLTLNRRWGYDRNDHAWKSPEMVVRCMVDVASKGGNFLINIGPTGEGEVPAPSVERLHALGDWLKTNGEAIHGAGPARFVEAGGTGVVFQEIRADGSEVSAEPGGAAKTHEVGLPRGWRVTSKPGCLYFHFFDAPGADGFRLKTLPVKVKRVSLLAEPARSLEFSQDGGGLQFHLPEGVLDPRATVVKVEYEEAAGR